MGIEKAKELKAAAFDPKDYLERVKKVVTLIAEETDNPNDALRVLEGATASVINTIERIFWDSIDGESLLSAFDLNVRSWMNSMKD